MLKLRDPNPRVASYVLAALGELAIVGGEGILLIYTLVIAFLDMNRYDSTS